MLLYNSIRGVGSLSQGFQAKKSGIRQVGFVPPTLPLYRGRDPENSSGPWCHTFLPHLSCCRTPCWEHSVQWLTPRPIHWWCRNMVLRWNWNCFQRAFTSLMLTSWFRQGARYSAPPRSQKLLRKNVDSGGVQDTVCLQGRRNFCARQPRRSSKNSSSEISREGCCTEMSGHQVR